MRVGAVAGLWLFAILGAVTASIGPSLPALRTHFEGAPGIAALVKVVLTRSITAGLRKYAASGSAR